MSELDFLCVRCERRRRTGCHTYPYQYDDTGVIDGMATGCPLELLRPGRELIDELGMNIADARRWHRQLYEELQLDHVDA